MDEDESIDELAYDDEFIIWLDAYEEINRKIEKQGYVEGRKIGCFIPY